MAHLVSRLETSSKDKRDCSYWKECKRATARLRWLPRFSRRNWKSGWSRVLRRRACGRGARQHKRERRARKTQDTKRTSDAYGLRKMSCSPESRTENWGEYERLRCSESIGPRAVVQALGTQIAGLNTQGPHRYWRPMAWCWAGG